MEEEISVLDEIKKNLKTKRLVYGTETSMKALKLGKLSKVFISSNTAKPVVDDFEHYSKLSGAELVKTDMPNDDMGVFCKKSFAVSVVGLLK